MRQTLWRYLFLLWLLPLVSCELQPDTAPATPTGDSAATEATAATELPAAPTGATTAPEPAATATGTETALPVTGPVTITVFYTNDEHGWMEGMEPGAGAASILSHWQQAGYDPDGPYLALSGGDMWTGPAISTWFEGEGMVEVMNRMGYAAAAVGNHEFDFGLDALRARALESDFPLLSANLRTTTGDRPTHLEIAPYTVVDVAGVQVGIIGLTTVRTPTTTNPVNLEGLDFLDYEDSLREVIPEARAAGAELLLVTAHICEDELVALAQQVRDLEIAMIGGGHCNERIAREVNGITLVEGGYHFTSYAMVELTFDPQKDEVLNASYEVVLNNPAGNPDASVAEIVARWRAQADAELEVVIGYSEHGLARRSAELHRLLPASWLVAYPEADIALTNPGGFRADLPAGPLTFAGVVGVLPFNNVLVDVTLSGEELEQVLSFNREADVAGVRRESLRWVLADGTSIDPQGSYRLITTDFLYAGGDGYEMLARLDPEAYNTGIDWRQPLIDWIVAQESNENQPLDAAFADLANP